MRRSVAAEETQETSLRYPPPAGLRALDLPVTIAIGERSQPYFHRIARHVQRLVPGAQRHSVPEASHAVHLDAPDQVAALL
jgi:pimeloyl-ACP methyl ester carboxylesterase